MRPGTGPREALWAIRVKHTTWSAELRYHPEWGVEAQILRDGDLVIGRRFDTKARAVDGGRAEGDSHQVSGMKGPVRAAEHHE
jgi:hypothetical protein